MILGFLVYGYEALFFREDGSTGGMVGMKV
jgi:hypothetical protein